MQIAGEKELGEYNKWNALDIWEKTGYEAQVKQMENAGLNPGLLYSKGGGGGTTQGAQAGNVTGQQTEGGKGNPGMGLEMGLMLSKVAAEITLMKAQAKKTETEANNLGEGGIDTQLKGAQIGSLQATTANTALQNAGIEWDNKMKEIQTNIAKVTEQEAIDQARMMNQQLQAKVEIEKNNKKVSDETINETIKQANIKTAQMLLDKNLTTANIGNVNTQAIATHMANMRAEGQQEWDMLQDQEMNFQFIRKMDHEERKQFGDLLKSIFGALLVGGK